MHPKKIKTTTVVFEESFANLTGPVSQSLQTPTIIHSKPHEPSSSEEELSQNRQRLDTSSEDQIEELQQSQQSQNEEEPEIGKEESIEEPDSLFERKEQILRKKETLAEQTIRENVQKVL